MIDSGKGREFELFVHARSDELFRFAYLLVGHREDAEDLVQAALLKTARRWETVAACGAPHAYARQVVLNLARDRWRRLRRRPAESLFEPDVVERVDAHPAAVPGEDSAVSALMDRDELLRATRTLAPRLSMPSYN